MLNLLPDQLFSLTVVEFWNMVEAKLFVETIEQDKEYEYASWFTSLIMSSSGNYGKKGIDPKKLYKRRLDNLGRSLEVTSDSKFTQIDKDEKKRAMDALLAKFNK